MKNSRRRVVSLLLLSLVLVSCGGGGDTSGNGGPPAATTLAATSVAATRSTLNGNVTPNGLATNAWFEWGTDPTLAACSATPAQPVGSGTTSVPVNASLSGLSPGTIYYGRVAASNSSDTSRGVIFIFTTCDPVVTVLLSTGAISESLSAGDEVEVRVEGTWSATQDPGDLFFGIRDDAGSFGPPGRLTRTPGNGFTLYFDTLPELGPGRRTGNITVLAFQDAACTRLFRQGSASVSYELNLSAVGDWGTMQRDPAHRGYVPILLNPARFRKVWEWSRAIDDPVGGVNPVVTADGKVYVSTDVYFGNGILYALNEADGTEAWRVSFGRVPALNPPAVDNGRVFVSVTGHADTFLWAFDALTGAFLRKSAFEGQWPHVLAPTVYGDQVYTNGGYYGGSVYAFSVADGSRIWVANKGDDDMATPAVDNDHVYFHSGNTLEIWDRNTGATVASISDPFGNTSGYSYHGAPVIGSRGNVVAFAGDAFSGRASSNTEQYERRVFSSFLIGTRAWEWATSNAYLTAPALENGVIYAGRNSPMSLDAISEATGRVLWSWSPSGQGDAEFHRNVIVTRNLLFASTDRAVYAIDLNTRTPVWRYPEPGMLALSASRTLYIATGARESNGRVVAVKLN